MTHSPPTAVLFDIDGTLIDSVDAHTRAWQEALRAFGHDIPYDEVRRQIGKGGDFLLQALLPKQECEERGDAIEELCTKTFAEKEMPHLRPFPEVRALFERIKADGLRIALATSAKADEVETYEHLCHVHDLVHHVATSDDADRSKPYPDIFQAALAELGADAAEAVAVGDTPYDAEAAGRAGIRTIGVLSGGFPEDDLRRAGCVAVYRDVADLLARYDDSPLAPAHG